MSHTHPHTDPAPAVSPDNFMTKQGLSVSSFRAINPAAPPGAWDIVPLLQQLNAMRSLDKHGKIVYHRHVSPSKPGPKRDRVSDELVQQVEDAAETARAAEQTGDLQDTYDGYDAWNALLSEQGGVDMVQCQTDFEIVAHSSEPIGAMAKHIISLREGLKRGDELGSDTFPVGNVMHLPIGKTYGWWDDPATVGLLHEYKLPA